MKMEQAECSKMFAFKTQMPGNHPKERIQQVTPRYCVTVLSFFKDSLIYYGYSTFFSLKFWVSNIAQPGRLVSNLMLNLQYAVDTEITLLLGYLWTLISVYKWTLLGNCVAHRYSNIMHEGKKTGLWFEFRGEMVQILTGALCPEF
jgi:hypothetical protein